MIDESAQTWRMRERMKTVSVALVVCLNIGVDPPDVKKTEPCSRMECWINPLTLNSQRALETIGNNLQKQYERWQPRARYRQSLDPTVEEVRHSELKEKFCYQNLPFLSASLLIALLHLCIFLLERFLNFDQIVLRSNSF